MHAQMEIDMGNFSDAQDILDNIPAFCELEEDALANHDQVIEYFDLQLDLAGNEESFCDCTDGNISELQAMAEGDHAAGGWARAVLELHDIPVAYREPIFLPSAGPGKRESTHQFPDVKRPESRIFPNPAYDLLNISLGEVPAEAELRLYIHDVNGQLVFTQLLNAAEDVISIAKLPAGVYMISVHADKQHIYEEKLIILEK